MVKLLMQNFDTIKIGLCTLCGSYSFSFQATERGPETVEVQINLFSEEEPKIQMDNFLCCRQLPNISSVYCKLEPAHHLAKHVNGFEGKLAVQVGQWMCGDRWHWPSHLTVRNVNFVCWSWVHWVTDLIPSIQAGNGWGDIANWTGLLHHVHRSLHLDTGDTWGLSHQQKLSWLDWHASDVLFQVILSVLSISDFNKSLMY